MKKRYALILAGLMVAGIAATGIAADYYGAPPPGGTVVYAPPPPPRGAQVPPPRHAQYGQTYFFGHLGVFDPNSDTGGLSGYDSGLSFDLGVGSRVSPILAVDGTIGGYTAKRGSDEASVVPLTIGARLILPNPFFEPYFGAGMGLYFSSLTEAARPGYSGIDDSQTDFGGYLSAGFDMWLNPRTALNFEGKYNYVDPTFHSNAGNSFGVNLSGWTLNLGIRIAF
jgi:hypothetical protein